MEIKFKKINDDQSQILTAIYEELKGVKETFGLDTPKAQSHWDSFLKIIDKKETSKQLSHLFSYRRLKRLCRFKDVGNRQLCLGLGTLHNYYRTVSNKTGEIWKHLPEAPPSIEFEMRRLEKPKKNDWDCIPVSPDANKISVPMCMKRVPPNTSIFQRSIYCKTPDDAKSFLRFGVPVFYRDLHWRIIDFGHVWGITRAKEYGASGNVIYEIRKGSDFESWLKLFQIDIYCGD